MTCKNDQKSHLNHRLFTRCWIHSSAYQKTTSASISAGSRNQSSAHHQSSSTKPHRPRSRDHIYVRPRTAQWEQVSSRHKAAAQCFAQGWAKTPRHEYSCNWLCLGCKLQANGSSTIQEAQFCPKCANPHRTVNGHCQWSLLVLSSTDSIENVKTCHGTSHWHIP